MASCLSREGGGGEGGGGRVAGSRRIRSIRAGGAAAVRGQELQARRWQLWRVAGRCASHVVVGDGEPGKRGLDVGEPEALVVLARAPKGDHCHLLLLVGGLRAHTARCTQSGPGLGEMEELDAGAPAQLLAAARSTHVVHAAVDPLGALLHLVGLRRLPAGGVLERVLGVLLGVAAVPTIRRGRRGGAVKYLVVCRASGGEGVRGGLVTSDVWRTQEGAAPLLGIKNGCWARTLGPRRERRLRRQRGARQAEQRRPAV